MRNFEINIELVRKLIDTQFPQWSHLHIRSVENEGNDNRTFHLGNIMSVRLPSAERYASQVEKENYWLPKLAPHISIPITTPRAIGKPDFGYPFAWAVNKWIEGTPLSINDTNKGQIAIDLAKFLRELQGIECTNNLFAGEHNFYRGGDLFVYNCEVQTALTKLVKDVDTQICKQIWEKALSSKWHKQAVWVHGDVAIGNLLQCNNVLSGVIDFGILGAGDPACDLVMAWTYFDDSSRAIFMQEMAMDSDTWDRARGWALWKALITYDNESSKQVVRALEEGY